MKIAILASEAAPYIKSGGLGDVMEALPAALSRIDGNEVALLLPYYKKVLDDPAFETECVARLQVDLGWRKQYAGVHQVKGGNNGVQVYLIDNLYYFGGRSGLYGEPDDGERFAFFSKACLEALCAIDFIPDVIQCNDWQTSLVPVFLRAQYSDRFPNTKVMFTIHNIEYQGWADNRFFDDVLALPEAFRQRLEMSGRVNCMKAGIETADLVTTVSETYAKELMYPYYSHGMDSVLAGNAGKLTGITNGIDVNTFNPETDSALPAHYNADTFESGKAICKKNLQKEVGLPVQPDVPLMVMVTRLAGHKGLDLLCHIARDLLQEADCQLLILGTGERHFEEFFLELQKEFPQQVAARITFDLALASRIYAGGDIYLMPSKSEPCGLSQMNAMRYGAVPVVHATGGLKDTVPPVDSNGEGGLGFTFQSFNAHDFAHCIKRCLHLYRQNPGAFRALQRKCMAQDFSWGKPAKKYMELFRKMLD